jgi:hypothetical protein
VSAILTSSLERGRLTPLFPFARWLIAAPALSALEKPTDRVLNQLR